ncbi:MAG: VCBS domain-containing protein [Pseudomonadota bacterium]
MPFYESGLLGDLYFDTFTGVWEYRLNADSPDLTTLNDGDVETDRFTIESVDGTASTTLRITVEGADDTCESTLGDDALQGTNKRDVDSLLAGDNSYDARGGRDKVNGGGGRNDKLRGNAGRDELID